MLLKPYNNTCIDLSNTPLIEFYESSESEKGTGRKLYNLKFGSGTTSSHYYKEMIEEVKKGIAEYNKSGRGNYYWLFNNVCVNLDIAGSVNRYGDKLHVSYAGGEWWSSAVGNAKEIYAEYLEAADLRQKKLALVFASAVVKQEPEKFIEPEKTRVIGPSSDMAKIVKRYGD